MSGKIIPIKAKDDNGIEQVIFPNTVLEAVVDSETNETLDNIIDKLKHNGGATYELGRTDDTITLTGSDGNNSEVDVSDKVDKVDGKGLSTNDYTTTEKNKLAGIASGANAYIHPSYTARTGVPTANQTPAFGGTFSVTQPVSDAIGHITGMNSRTVKIPNTVASSSANGLMSSADKTKLDAFRVLSGYANGKVVTISLTAGKAYLVVARNNGGMVGADVIGYNSNGSFNVASLMNIGSKTSAVSGTTYTMTFASGNNTTYHAIEF